MERFLEEYPSVARLLISLAFMGLLYFGSAYMKQVIENNTRALEELACVLKEVVKQVNGHEVILAEHELRLERLEDGK